MSDYSVTLSTTDPNNYVGLIKLRQGDVASQSIQATITANGQLFKFDGLSVFFNAVLPNGNVIRDKVTEVDYVNSKLNCIVADSFLQEVTQVTAWFSFENDEKIIDSTKNFQYSVIAGWKECIKQGNYIYELSEIQREIEEIISNKDFTSLISKISSLETRIDGLENETTAQLADKASQVEVQNKLNLKRDKSDKLELEDMSETTLGAITGQGTFNLLSVPQDRSVTDKKMDKSVKNIFPFIEDATLSFNGTDTFAKIKNAIKHIELYGADKTKRYCVESLYRRRNPDPYTWTMKINQINDDETSKRVSTFETSSYNEPNRLDEITLTQFNGSGITGKAIIDWSALDLNTAFYSMGFNETGLHPNSYNNGVDLKRLPSIPTSKIDSKAVTVDKLEDLAGLNMYPFHRKAIIQSNKSNAMAVLEAIKDIKLYGTNPNLKYRISELYRNRYSYSNNNWTWWVGIRDNNNLEACRFRVVVTTSNGYIEPTGVTKLTFTSRNDSGITGEVWIDWSKLPDNIAWTTTYDELGLDEKTYLGVTEQHTVDLSGVTPRVIEDKVINTHLIRQHYLENLSVSVPKINNLIDVNTLTFSVLTDIHNTDSVAIRSSTEIFGVITEYCDHDFLANLGDLIPGNFDKPKSLRQANDIMQLVNQHSKCPHYVIRGNHDVNDYELVLVPTEAEKVSRIITNKEWYQVTTKKSEKYGIVQDPDNIYAGYYYVDNPKQKIRSIFLNTSETKDWLTSSSDYTWWGVQSEKQLKWFANVALNLQGKSDWAVMIFSHIPPFSTDFIHNHGVDRIAVRAISESFLYGSSGSAPTSNPSFPSVSFDFSEQGPRELIGHFMGHVHDDYYEKINGVNYFISTSGTPYQKYDTAPPRSENGLDTLSMNTMVVNREKRRVDVIKTGSGKDWSFTW